MNQLILSKRTIFHWLALVLILSCNPNSEKNKANNSPNIVLIISDDQAWTDYSFMNHSHVETPNIDQLARESLTFTRGYVPTSLCAPSLASIITGLYPRQHLVLGNDRFLPGNDLSQRSTWRSENYKPVIEHFKTLTTLPEMLKAKDYLSFQTGKWWLGNFINGGFDEGMTHGDPERGGRHGDYGLEIGRNGLDTLFNYIDFALKKEQPFFMWYAPFLPHNPHNPPDSLLQKYITKAPSEFIAKYWAMCEWFDITCGQLMDFIDEKGQTENTLFIYVCDNGWVQNEDNPRYNEISKRSPYDYGIRTPIMYKWKGVIQPRQESNMLSSSVDIIPTILGILDLEQPEELKGINVLDQKKLEARKAIFGEIYDHDFNTVEESICYRMAITNPYKLIVPDAQNKPNEKVELYDIYGDPNERINLADSLPDKVQELEDMIDITWKMD